MLVQRGVLPGALYRTDSGKPVLAPRLLGTARELEKQRVKDVLRSWVDRRWRSLEEDGDTLVRSRGMWEPEHEKPRVRDLARRYSQRGRQRGEVRWGKGRVERNDPPRAKVLGLRRFYERLATPK